MNELSETTENYLKQIHILVIKNGSARVSDIAERLGRRLSTVTGAVQRMASDGLINYRAYGKITLTDKGSEAAKSILKNYNTLQDFLIMIGVDSEIADLDACEMEHISQISMNKIKEFYNFMKSDADGNKSLIKYQESIS